MEHIKYKGQELLPPKSDLVFKAIFGREENKYILAGFLRDVLDLVIEDYHDIEFMNTEKSPRYADDKLMRLDVAVKLKNGQRIDVEIQVDDKHNMVERSLAYESDFFSAQVTKGTIYEKLNKTITLVILDYNLFKDEDFYYNIYRFKNIRTNKELSELMEIRYLELPKLKASDRLEELGNRELWALFLRTEREEVLDLLAQKSDELEKAVEKLVTVSAEEKLRHEYRNRLFAEMDYNSGMYRAREEGLTTGIEQGLATGIRQGRLETAKNLKANGVSDEIITKTTGLTLEEISDL